MLITAGRGYRSQFCYLPLDHSPFPCHNSLRWVVFMEISQNEDGKFNPKEKYEILSNEQISSKICEIIRGTEEFCFIVTPYIKIWPHLEIRLKTASEQKKKIIFFLRENQDEKHKEKFLNDIKEFNKKYSFDIFLIKNLHAKIYLNEKEALISSMNLYEYSQEHNHEIGIYFKNKKMINEIIEKNIIEDIFGVGKIDGLTLKGNYPKLLENNLFLYEKSFYCVLCGKAKTFRLREIYCEDCSPSTGSEDTTKWQYCYKCGVKFKRTDRERTIKMRQCRKCTEEDRQKKTKLS